MLDPSPALSGRKVKHSRFKKKETINIGKTVVRASRISVAKLAL